MRSVLVKCALLAGSLLFVEILFSAAAALSPPVAYLAAPAWERDVPIREDPVLGFVGNPLKRDHDPRGFRNAWVPERVDLVALGDSQTYGTGVSREQAWPLVLGRLDGLGVYSMALPGHGPAHGLLRMDEVLALRPRVVVAAVYFGNDFYDGFALARVHPELREGVPTDLWEQAAALEEREPFTFGFAAVFGGETAEEERRIGPVRRFLSDHSTLYGLLREIRFRLRPRPDAGTLSKDFETAVAQLSDAQRAYFSAYQEGGWRTILTAGYRARVLDDGDPRVRAGFAVTVQALRQLARRAEAAGARLVVVLIPTKEFVFAPRVGTPEAHTGLARLVALEERWRQRLLRELADLPRVDAAVALRAAPTQPYFEDADGHPNADGQALIAEAVRRELAVAPR